MSALGFEQLAERRSGPVLSTAPAQQPQQPAASEPVRVSEEQYAGMSHAEKLDYCRKFPQPQTDGR